jgi:xanthine dehydrogenase YagR molybdenum-binding subunit
MRRHRVETNTCWSLCADHDADAPYIEVIFVGEPDRFHPIGVKGVGEIGLIGIAAAIPNAVFPATRRRIRSLPITID